MSKPDLSGPIDSMFSTVSQKPKVSETPSRVALVPKPAVRQAKPVVNQQHVAKQQPVSTVLPSQTSTVGEAFNRFTIVMEKDKKTWLANKATEIKDNHNLGRANFSNLLSYLVAKAQEDGIDHNEYIEYVKNNRVKG